MRDSRSPVPLGGPRHKTPGVQSRAAALGWCLQLSSVSFTCSLPRTVLSTSSVFWCSCDFIKRYLSVKRRHTLPLGRVRKLKSAEGLGELSRANAGIWILQKLWETKSKGKIREARSGERHNLSDPRRGPPLPQGLHQW